jgi:hypothetical protein
MIFLLGLCCALGLSLASAQARDHKAPTLTITGPTSATTYSTTATQVTVSGTAHDPGGGVMRVTWQTDHGTQGVATGTTQWTCALTLAAGTTTHVTVTATDKAGNQGSDTLAITVLSAPPPPPPPGPITVDWSYPGATGDAFQMERCTSVTGQPCPMAPVAAIAIQDRTWVDQNVQPDLDYCYRMAVTTGGQVGPYSNMMCSP